MFKLGVEPVHIPFSVVLWQLMAQPKLLIIAPSEIRSQTAREIEASSFFFFMLDGWCVHGMESWRERGKNSLLVFLLSMMTNQQAIQEIQRCILNEAICGGNLIQLLG